MRFAHCYSWRVNQLPFQAGTPPNVEFLTLPPASTESVPFRLHGSHLSSQNQHPRKFGFVQLACPDERSLPKDVARVDVCSPLNKQFKTSLVAGRYCTHQWRNTTPMSKNYVGSILQQCMDHIHLLKRHGMKQGRAANCTVPINVSSAADEILCKIGTLFHDCSNKHRPAIRVASVWIKPNVQER